MGKIMKTRIKIIEVRNNEEVSAKLILETIKNKEIVYITKNNKKINQSIYQINFEGPAIILNSSGSTNKKKKCIHSINNITASAKASGIWLEDLGIELRNCIIFNTLPLNHISGLMPLWRSRIWNCNYTNISPELIKNTEELIKKTIFIKGKSKKYLITSLVPTQLYRLLSVETGIYWLKLFDVIWVGGASISNKISEKCRAEKIKLSPCYGATETSAMITCLKPNDFLKGYDNAGKALSDINLRISKQGLIEVQSKRIGKELVNFSKFKSFKDKDEWWSSSDLGEIININHEEYLKVYGRIDNAFNSGGETIFPDLIKSRIKEFVIEEEIPIDNLMLKIVKDDMWGNRYVLILYFKKNTNTKIMIDSLNKLKNYSDLWPKHERPLKWEINNEDEKIELKVKNWKKYY